ncbi:T9SS type A sorting domain-containing protein [Pedobacter sp.]
MKKLYFLFLIVFGSLTTFAQTVRYVKPVTTGTGDGSSWANATADLQAMINASSSGDQVWVAAGTYKPTEKLQAITYVASPGVGDPTTDRDKAFILKGGVKIYGGFSGSETILSQRNFLVNTTILSGDLNNDNTASDGDCYHVVSSRNSADDAELDGFTIQHGYANGTAAVSANGTTGTSSTTVAQNVGGGIAVRGTNNAIKWSNLIIKDNQSFDSGGGAYLRVSGTDVVFEFTNVSFVNNKTFGEGGGLFVYDSLDQPILRLDKVSFISNATTSTLTGTNDGVGGGGLCIYGATSTSFLRFEIKNTVFYDNASARTTAGGAAIYIGSYSNGSVVNCTFYKNLAAGTYGAIGFNNGSSTTFKLYNNIFNQNSTDIRSGTAAIQDLKFNLFQNSFTTSGSRTVSNNITNSSPSSLFASTVSTDADFLKLAAGTSVALDAGDNSLSTSLTDLLGNPRIRNTKIDLGAYEFQLGNYPLPVEFSTFTAVKQNNTAVLAWKTASERNSSKFVIERGSTVNNFKFLKEVSAAGNSNSPLSYAVTDFSPLSGINYYRLVQYDKDGTSEVLSMQSLRFDLTTTVKVYPNPAVEYVSVASSSADGVVSLNLISLTGKTVLTNNYAQTTTQVSVQLNLANVPKGAYILWINKGKISEEKQTLLVVK